MAQFDQHSKSTRSVKEVQTSSGEHAMPQASEAPGRSKRELTDDERAAVEFYTLNPSAAVRDLDNRLSIHRAPEASEADNWRQYALLGETTAGQVCARLVQALIDRPQANAPGADEREVWTTGDEDLDTALNLVGTIGDAALAQAEAVERLKCRLASAPVADERAAYVAWLGRSFPNAYNEADAVRLWQHGHVSALAWQRRAALASAPAADTQRIREWLERSQVPGKPYLYCLKPSEIDAALASAPAAVPVASAPVEEREAFEAVAGLTPPCASRRGNDFREGYLEAKVDALRLLRGMGRAPVAGEAPSDMPTPIWWINHGRHGQITLRHDEADRARQAGATVYQYHAAPQASEAVRGHNDAIKAAAKVCTDIARQYDPQNNQENALASELYSAALAIRKLEKEEFQPVEKQPDGAVTNADPADRGSSPVAMGTNRVLEAAREVLRWTDVSHRPPVREKFPAGGTARVRIHALADLHDAVSAASAPAAWGAQAVRNAALEEVAQVFDGMVKQHEAIRSTGPFHSAYRGAATVCRDLMRPAARMAAECEPCNGMGFRDGVGDACLTCDGDGTSPASCTGTAASIMRFNIHGNRIHPHPSGMYVQYEDHAAVVQAARRQDGDGTSPVSGAEAAAGVRRFEILGNLINPHPNGMFVRHEEHIAALRAACNQLTGTAAGATAKPQA